MVDTTFTRKSVDLAGDSAPHPVEFYTSTYQHNVLQNETWYSCFPWSVQCDGAKIVGQGALWSELRGHSFSKIHFLLFFGFLRSNTLRYFDIPL